MRVVKGFLTEREIKLSFKGEKSESKRMSGGGPQGTILGMFLFIVLINFIGFEKCNTTIGATVTSNLKGRIPIQTMHAKFIDDLTIASSINLNTSLQKEQDDFWVRPVSFHNRTGHTLKTHMNIVQEQLTTISNYAEKNEMEINKKKSKVMIFNNTKKLDFMPSLLVKEDELEVVNSIKILGTIITSDLKWKANTEYMIKRGYSKLWVLRRLKKTWS